MYGGGACVYNAAGKVRCLDAILGDTTHTRFVLGTTNLHHDNHLHVVEYDAAANTARRLQLHAHAAQVVDLAPCPFDASLVVTCGRSKSRDGGSIAATLWKMATEDAVGDSGNAEPRGDAATAAPAALTQVAAFKTANAQPTNGISRFVWQRDGSRASAQLASAQEDGSAVHIWRLSESSMAPLQRLPLYGSDRDAGSEPTTPSTHLRLRRTALSWDPHHPQYLSVASGAGIQTWDTRASPTTPCWSISDAHGAQSVLDIDYNPNKPFTLASGGEDGRLKFWDVRHAARALLALPTHTHSHWVQQVAYNPFHDQLVLSGSSDATLALWRVSSVSSAPIVEMDEQDLMNEAASGHDAADARIRSYDEHEDSVYALAWSASDSWTFASVSYDGRLAVNVVPSTEKYKILL